VIVDLASEQGGNCELTEPGKVVVKYGVTVIGYTDMPSRLAKQSSNLYSSNLWRLMQHLCPTNNGQINIDMNDELSRGVTVVREGQITWPAPSPKMAAPPVAELPKGGTTPEPMQKRPARAKSNPFVVVGLGIATLLLVGAVAPPSFISHFTVFILACFVGYMVVWNVTPALHTPLMSVTNAISSVIAIGAIMQLANSTLAIQVLACAALTMTMINMFGGFAVTQRMLAMFRK
jgi:NAD(P) transhydrogenase subunit alpha